MKFSDELHAAFADRLCHYHLSAFNGFHDVFYTNQNEKNILSGVKDLSKPLIHEGGSTKLGKDSLLTEDKFVRDFFG